jgi:hypothetical protein
MRQLQLSSPAGKVSLVVSAALGAFSLAPPARACTYGSTDIESSYPADGEVGVPTNVVLYVAGELVAPEALSLGAEASEPVPITVRRVLPSGFDVIPAIELEPEQRYYLRLILNEGSAAPLQSTLEFETGSGPAEPAVLPPPDLTRAVLLRGDNESCSFSRLCLEPGGSGTTLLAAHSQIQLSQRAPGTLMTRYDHADVPDDCLHVWRRDALGNRSETVELCGADVPRIDLVSAQERPTCQEVRQGLLTGAYSASPDDAPETIAADAAGCGLVRSRVAGSPFAHWSVVLAVLATLGVSRRRASAVRFR